MTRNIVIVGCGGLGREAFSLLEALRESGDKWSVEGFVDDDPAEENVALVKELGSGVLGPVTWLAGRGAMNAVIAIGSNAARAEISERLSSSPGDVGDSGTSRQHDGTEGRDRTRHHQSAPAFDSPRTFKWDGTSSWIRT